MARNYIVLIRTDIPQGVLQVLDLQPNTSTKNLVYEPEGQTCYRSYIAQNDTVAVTGVPLVTDAEYKGLAAYFIDHVENVGGGNLALTAAQANGVAAGIVAVRNAGGPLTLSVINTVINAVAGITVSDLNGLVAGSNSSGSVEDVLRILAGEEYVLPAGSTVSGALSAFVAAVGAFVSPKRVRDIVTSAEFEISRLSGHLAAMKDPTFTYLGVTGAAIVLYDNAGNVI